MRPSHSAGLIVLVLRKMASHRWLVLAPAGRLGAFGGAVGQHSDLYRRGVAAPPDPRPGALPGTHRALSRHHRRQLQLLPAGGEAGRQGSVPRHARAGDSDPAGACAQRAGGRADEAHHPGLPVRRTSAAGGEPHRDAEEVQPRGGDAASARACHPAARAHVRPGAGRRRVRGNRYQRGDAGSGADHGPHLPAARSAEGSAAPYRQGGGRVYQEGSQRPVLVSALHLSLGELPDRLRHLLARLPVHADAQT